MSDTKELTPEERDRWDWVLDGWPEEAAELSKEDKARRYEGQ